MAKIDLSKLDAKTLRAIVKSEKVEDFLTFVKKKEVKLSDEEATEIYNILNVDLEEMTEEQLAMVSGGFHSSDLGNVHS